MKQGKYVIVTDGSAGDDIMSFVWKVGDVDDYSMLDNKIYTTVNLDNTSMINRIAKQKTYPYDYSFHTIDPDWDTIAQICDILEIMNIKAEFEHVKGYQDDDTPYKELKLPTQLNIN
eukprot:8072204-Ditylum_brightwellii.AAC.1